MIRSVESSVCHYVMNYFELLFSQVTHLKCLTTPMVPSFEQIIKLMICSETQTSFTTAIMKQHEQNLSIQDAAATTDTTFDHQSLHNIHILPHPMTNSIIISNSIISKLHPISSS